MTLYHLIQRLRQRPTPIVLLSAPLAGAPLLARLIGQAEHVVPLGPGARQRTEELLARSLSTRSDRLVAEDASASLVAELQRLRAIKPGQRVLEQAGANALRIPFHAAAFPAAQFVLLVGEPREQLARMIAAWRTGRYITYQALEGWEGPWSLPLIPGWQALRGRTIPEVVLAQWSMITRIMLDDFAELAPERRLALSAAALRADPYGSFHVLSHLGLHWPRPPRPETFRPAPLHPADLAAADALLPLAEDLTGRLHRALHHSERQAQLPVAPLLPKRVRQLITTGSVAAGLLGTALAPAQIARATTFAVTNLGDSGPGSLRQAIADANATVGSDTITFQDGLSGAITLTGGQIKIHESLAIQGPGAETLTISGNNSSRIFYLYNRTDVIDVSISGLTITQGSAERGGAILDRDENLTLDGVTISGNSASGNGGGVWNNGFQMQLIIRGSTISGNSATASGGGIYFYDSGAPTLIQDSVIAQNQAGAMGGGIFLYGPDHNVTIQRSTISANTASGNGGGINLHDTDGGDLIIQDSTISGNQAASGGGAIAYLNDALVIQSSTITGNTARSGSGGGIAATIYGAGASFTVQYATIAGNTAAESGGGILSDELAVSISHTIIADNSAGSDPDIATLGGSVDLRFSLVETPGTATLTNGGGNILSQDPQLSALGDNGGPTQTQLPAFTSPAVNAGDLASVIAETDQRGAERIVNGRVDMGAIELNPGTVGLVEPDAAIGEGGLATFTLERTDGSDGPVSVAYTTADQTAKAGKDYTATSGTMSWATGDLQPKMITIPIIDESDPSPDKSLSLRLSNPQGARLGAITTAAISIINNDFVAYLPTISYRLQPDLAVTKIALNPDKASFVAGEPVEIAVTITNQGTTRSTPFWVDLYIDPSTPPDAVNQPWDERCGLTPCYGVAWGVKEMLDPGESVTLTTAVTSYEADYTTWPGFFASGTTIIYVYADSWKDGSLVGNVTEADETNNRGVLGGLSVTGPNPQELAAPQQRPAGPRPDIGDGPWTVDDGR